MTPALDLPGMAARAEQAAKSREANPVSELTRQYWINAFLAIAAERLAPPQYDECLRAMLQETPAAAALAADVTALLAEVARLTAVGDELKGWRDEYEFMKKQFPEIGYK